MRVSSIRRVPGIRTVYDISVADNHNFFVRTKHGSVLTHNCQNLTGASEQAVLKPLEDPPKLTTFILCSMEPEKLHAALRGRCTQFVLAPPAKEDVIKQLSRIVKREEMSYVDSKVLSKIADNSNGEMRTAAQLLESLQQYASSLPKLPKELDPKVVAEVFSSTETKDDQVAIRILLGVYTRKFSIVQKAILDVQDGFGLMNKLIWLNMFMLNNYVLKGERHSKVWPNKNNLDLLKQVEALPSDLQLGKNRLGIFATTNAYLVKLRTQGASFLIPEQVLLSSTLYELILSLSSMERGGK